MTRAKFYVNQIIRTSGWNGATIKLQPVYSNDPQHENKKFWEATPSGSIELNINNPDAVEEFELGKEYFVDFTPAE